MTKRVKPAAHEDLIAIIEQAWRAGSRELVLRGKAITEIPPEIGRLTELRTLDFSNPYSTPGELKNRVSSFPEEIGQLTNLETLNLAGNELRTLPGSIQALRGLEELNLSRNQLETLPKSIFKLNNLRKLDVSTNRLANLSDFICDLTGLREIRIGGNKLNELPECMYRLRNLENLDIGSNRLAMLPEFITKMTGLRELSLGDNPISTLPNSIGNLSNLRVLFLYNLKLKDLPQTLSNLSALTGLSISYCGLQDIPKVVFDLTSLESLYIQAFVFPRLSSRIVNLKKLEFLTLYGNEIQELPTEIGELPQLFRLDLRANAITSLPESIGNLHALKNLWLEQNQLQDVPRTIAQLGQLTDLSLDENPLNPTIKSVYDQGLEALKAYLSSLKEAEPLYEAKLVLVGEGDVGKTTLLKALTGRGPREGEKSTHGVSIDINSMYLPHPHQDGVNIQFNAWDFGGQEVYRVTHQFFFSRRSVYLLVWEPRMGVQQGQVEDWLRLIRLRVGSEAQVIIVSTHAKTGERIARIDKPVLLRDYGSMIVDFIEVDSLEDDPTTGDKYGILELRSLIAQAANNLEQMGMPFNVHWRSARDGLIQLGKTQPRVTYAELAEVCARHGLSVIDTRTLAGLMHDLGYIVYYGDDERLKDDVVLQPEWLTKAIGFILENRATQEREGLLPDSLLEDVWLNHSFENEPRYDPVLYPFFLRLMEKYDVSYRLDDGRASLVAQLVPQVRPSLPWLPEEEPNPDLRRLAMVYVMDEAPPGLVPWMIVRTHEYAFERSGHRLHWQKGMFLRNKRHGEALLELRGREFHLYTEAIWPEYFMNILRQTLSKLISDNWPGMLGRYTFNVPCRERTNGEMCQGRFDINALRDFLDDGDQTIRCQVCRTKQEIVELLFGFEDEQPREQLARIEGKLDVGLETVQKDIAGLESRVANSVMAIMRAMANEAKEGPRLFDVEPLSGSWKRLFDERYRLRLWCEADNCQHPVLEQDRGIYEFKSSREWVRQVAPYASFVAGVLKTLLPMVSPSVDVLFGSKTIEGLGISDHLDLMKEATKTLSGELKLSDPGRLQQGILNEDERSGLLALHALLRELDPQQAKLGLTRIPTYTGDFLWLCKTHYQLSQPKIADFVQ